MTYHDDDLAMAAHIDAIDKAISEFEADDRGPCQALVSRGIGAMRRCGRHEFHETHDPLSTFAWCHPYDPTPSCLEDIEEEEGIWMDLPARTRPIDSFATGFTGLNVIESEFVPPGKALIVEGGLLLNPVANLRLHAHLDGLRVAEGLASIASRLARMEATYAEMSARLNPWPVGDAEAANR